MRGPRLQIELDVFSGRPNPTWTLDSAQSAVVLRRLGQGAPRPATWDGLGYRGFLIRRLDRPTSSMTLLRVVRGLVIAEGPRPRAHEDAGGVEALLATQAHARGFGPLVGS